MFFLEINLNYYSSAPGCCSLVCDVVASCSCSCSLTIIMPSGVVIVINAQFSRHLIARQIDKGRPEMYKTTPMMDFDFEVL